MWVIFRKKLRLFWERPDCRDAEPQLRAWFTEAERANWRRPTDIKERHRNASILKDGRVCFNICGNKYRLVVLVIYRKQRIYVRFLGTHEEYDRIDANTV